MPINNKTLIGIGVAVFLLATAGFWWFQLGDSSLSLSSDETTSVADLVTDFGDVLKNVPLAAPTDVAAESIRLEYGPFVTADLLARWAHTPTDAPGRLTSSPWPERIDVQNVTKLENAYVVRGQIQYLTSLEMTEGGAASTENIILTVVEQNGEWRISDYRSEKTNE